MLTRILFTLLGILLCPCFAIATEKPNFIIFFVDDLGYGDVGCYGGRIATPNMDRMAREGIRFTSFYAQNVCGPSRAALMTGCYPIRCAEPGNRKNPHTVLHPREITIAELLHERGYVTACLGKWHLAGEGQLDEDEQGRLIYQRINSPIGVGPFPSSLMPNAQGFDEYYGTPLHNGFTRLHEPGRFLTQFRRNGRIMEQDAPLSELTGRYTEQAVRFIETNKDKPFFLYLSHNMPHVVLDASSRFKGQSGLGLYADVVSELDWSLGQVLDCLRRLNLDDRTLVLFTSDNGPWIEGHLEGKGGDDAHYGSAGALRGWKMTTWEGGLRVPAVVRWPGRIPGGTVSDQIVTTLDILPTVVSLAGGTLPGGLMIDGLDMSRYFLGKTDQSPRGTFYYYSLTHLQAVRSGPWKLVLPRPANPPWTSWYGRMIEEVRHPQLYHLQEDVSEQKDVASLNPQVVSDLIQLANDARHDLGDYNRIGRGARFFDEGPRRTDAAQW